MAVFDQSSRLVRPTEASGANEQANRVYWKKRGLEGSQTESRTPARPHETVCSHRAGPSLALAVEKKARKRRQTAWRRRAPDSLRGAVASSLSPCVYIVK